MNRLTELLDKKRSGLKSVFFTAGYPGLKDTIDIARHLERIDVDFIEIGMPFSDPVADGPVIQQSSMAAIENGMNLPLLLEQIKSIRDFSQIPIVLMGYLNPINKYGVHEFLRDARDAGADGLILPDLPPVIFELQFQQLFEELNLSWIPLITQQTAQERIQMLDAQCTGFLYAVSTSGVTGSRQSFSDDSLHFFDRLKAMDLKHPIMVGFGISSPSHILQVHHRLSGVIIGSAFVKLLGDSHEISQAVQKFTATVFGDHN